MDSYQSSREAAWGFAEVMGKIRVSYRGKLEPAEERVLNAMQCWGFFFHDFAALCEEIDREREDVRRRVFARFIALSLYEAFEDLPQLLGGALDRDMRLIRVPDADLAALASARLKLRGMRARYEGELKEIRMYVGAHRDHDGETQWKLMVSQDLTRLREAAVSMAEWSGATLQAMSPVLEFVARRIVGRCGPLRA